ncbi:MAG: phosphoribosyltransferase [Candidatus Omnitrophica bacterium]|nr:phosphoribosyltransferase [Candidatus Omnitrophota bacterium]MCA9431847.1 phosphoribosyltransferase [Candidatus Omnitrophota bacterium]MCA9435697.1 phosphoribosyltransferase [Candidatus Omnitrophota bacterium]MCA9446779.1 phosphoribosyltransferase [Candidatus Omnitrophota bacterium]
MSTLFQDRQGAGRRLGRQLKRRVARGENVVVLGLPRGGVPVAAEVARALDAVLDVLLVRKIGFPGHKELAVGAIAEGDFLVLNPSIFEEIPGGDAAKKETLDSLRKEEERKIEDLKNIYRATGDRQILKDRTVILVDDGLATGATMRVAAQAVRKQGVKRLIVAAPVAAPDAVELLSKEADEVVCLETPEPFMGVGRWFEEFDQVENDRVREILKSSRS